MISFHKYVTDAEKHIPENDDSSLFVLQSHGSIFCALVAHNLGLLFPNKS